MNDFIMPLTFSVDDKYLDRILHDCFKGLTALPETLERPLWSLNPANQPPKETNWLSFGIISRDESSLADLFFDPITNLYTQTATEELNVLVSCYGPDASATMNNIRNGLRIESNRWQLRNNGIVWVSSGNPYTTSYLINEQYVKRQEAIIIFRRSNITTWNVAPVYPDTPVSVSTSDPFKFKYQNLHTNLIVGSTLNTSLSQLQGMNTHFGTRSSLTTLLTIS